MIAFFRYSSSIINELMISGCTQNTSKICDKELSYKMTSYLLKTGAIQESPCQCPLEILCTSILLVSKSFFELKRSVKVFICEQVLNVANSNFLVFIECTQNFRFPWVYLFHISAFCPKTFFKTFTTSGVCFKSFSCSGLISVYFF